MFDKLMKLLGLIFFITALFLIKKEVAFIGVDAIKKALFSVSKTGIMSALFITVLNYIILSGYDFCALIYGGKRLNYPLILKESAVSFSLSNLTGHTYLSGFITRYLFLKPFGFFVAFHLFCRWPDFACISFYSFPYPDPAEIGWKAIESQLFLSISVLHHI